VSKGGVTKIVGQARRFGRVGIEMTALRFSRLFSNQMLSESSCDLADLQRMRQPVVENIAPFRGYHLSDFRKAGECASVQNSVTIPLGWTACVRYLFGVEATICFGRSGLWIYLDALPTVIFRPGAKLSLPVTIIGWTMALTSASLTSLNRWWPLRRCSTMSPIVTGSALFRT
jgi:hypothetical protein